MEATLLLRDLHVYLDQPGPEDFNESILIDFMHQHPNLDLNNPRDILELFAVFNTMVSLNIIRITGIHAHHRAAPGFEKKLSATFCLLKRPQS